MLYLYHKLPQEMQGTILYPLNQLKDVFPVAYEKEVGKYNGREFLLQTKIPILECLWNDVLHLSAVHPGEIQKALIDAGFAQGAPMRYVKIDPTTLDPEKTVLYRYIQNDNSDLTRADNFKTFDMADLEHAARIPEETMAYYKEMAEEGRRPLVYHRIPHILYQGTIDITQGEILTI